MKKMFSYENMSLLKGCNFLFCLVVTTFTLFRYQALQNVIECFTIITASVFVISGVLIVEPLLICFSSKQLCKFLYFAEFLSLILSQVILVFIMDGIINEMS